MQRYASVVGLTAEGGEDYVRLHASVWPDVLKQIKASNVQNYSMYRYGELLISYFEYVGEDFAADMAKMAEDPVTQKWWSLCKPLTTPVPERASGEWAMALPEIFHMD
jgi:L-rhamnose mutarotase